MSLKIYRLSAFFLVMAGMPVYSSEPCIPKRKCYTPLSSLCGIQAFSGLCADNVATFVNNSLFTRNQKNAVLTVNNVMSLDGICGENQRCQGGTIVGVALGFKVQLFQGENKNVCKYAGWLGNMSLEVYKIKVATSNVPITSCRLTAMQNVFSKNLMPKCTCEEACNSNTLNDEFAGVSETVEPTTPLVSHDCPDTRVTQSHQQFRVAFYTCASFFSGVASVLIVFLVTRMKKEKKWCFKGKDVKDVPSPGKWEGASDAVTTKVIAKHMVKDKSTAVIYEDAELKNSKASTQDEYVYCNLDKRKNACESATSVLGKMDITDLAYTNELKSEDVFENDLESSADQHSYFVLQNENYSVVEKFGDRPATHEETTAGSIANQSCILKAEACKQGTNVYFVLEKRPQ